MTNKQKLYSIALFSIAMVLMLVSIAGAAPFAYIPQDIINNVSVIDTATNKVTGTVAVGAEPFGVAAIPDINKVYVMNSISNSVSVIDTDTNTVIATVPVGSYPRGIAVTPDGTRAYVANERSNTVSIIDTATNGVTVTVGGFDYPDRVAVTPNGTKVYVANYESNSVSVIDTATNKVTATVPVGKRPFGVTVTPNGRNVYVTNLDSNTVSVIDTSTNTVTTNVKVGTHPYGVAVTPDGTKVYVTNIGNLKIPGTISVIDTSTNTVTTNVKVEKNLIAFGQFIGPMSITPIITWSNPADIFYGTALSSAQLDATATDPTTRNPLNGTFFYIPGQGFVLSAGSRQTLKTTFKPNDSTNYTRATSSVLINVNKTTPTITWSKPANITYGTALNSTQLDATASIPGTFVYIPSSGTVLSVGTQTLNTAFTPNDSVNYTTTSANVSFNVTKATPTVTWTSKYGTSLSTTQLDAAASIPGNFSYSQSSGIALSAGQQTLTATFTPTDTADYNTVSASVLINIAQATPTITWSNPADIFYGTPLSSTQLDATSSVPGTFVYNPPTGTILDERTQTLNAFFTPTDSVDYTTASASVSINVIHEHQNHGNDVGSNYSSSGAAFVPVPMMSWQPDV